MNSGTLTDGVVSRPKINRPPLSLAPAIDEWGADSRVIWRSMWGFSVIALSVLGFITYQYSDTGGYVDRVASIDNMRLMELVGAGSDYKKSDASALSFKEDGAVIVGRAVKISQNSEKTIPDKVAEATGFAAGNDKAAKKELLAILSKY